MQNSTSSNPEQKVVPLLLPRAGQTMEEGTIVKWLVGEGDRIEPGQIIYEVETDKATFEIESDQAGRIARIVVEEYESVPVLTPVAYLAERDEDVEEYLASEGGKTTEAKEPENRAEAAAEKTEQPVEAPREPATDRIKASPAAKKLAREKGVDLASIGQGSGPGGRIVSEDVVKSAPASTEAVRRRVSSMRKTIAKNLVASKQSIPHFYVRQTINAGPLYSQYKARKAEFDCTVNDLIVLACAKALMDFPAFRSQLAGEEILEYASANIGIAVGVEDGLVVPVVMDAQNLDLRKLSQETRTLIEAAREGDIRNMGKGVFTVTNMGMLGVDEFTAIINPPEAAILAVSAIREDVIVRDGSVRAGRVMTMTLSCDHRIIDGALAAKFITALQRLLEQPENLT